MSRLVLNEAAFCGIKDTKCDKIEYSDKYKEEMKKADKKIENYHKELRKTYISAKNMLPR